MSVVGAVASIEATLEMADAAIDSAQQAIDSSLSKGVNGPAWLASLAFSRDAAVDNRDRIAALLDEYRMRETRDG